jgi:transposase InsO family protein
MSDSLMDGSKVRVLNVIGDYNRQYLGFDIGRSLPAPRVTRALDDFIDFHGKPKRIRIDNGPEYTSHHMQLWAKDKEIELQFIQPGKPTQIATSSALTAPTAPRSSTRTYSRVCTRYVPSLKHFSTSTITLDRTDRSMTWHPWSLKNTENPLLGVLPVRDLRP